MGKKITNEVVKECASLAKLLILQQDMDKFRRHLENILEHMAEIDSVPTEGISPISGPIDSLLEQEQIHTKNWREDSIRPSLYVTELLKNAPDAYFNQFRLNSFHDE